MPRSPLFLAVLAAALVLATSARAAQPPSQPPQAAPTAPAGPLTLQDAIALARVNSQQLRSAQSAALSATEDRVQARANLLPSISGLTEYIYTQPNGTLSGVFVPNDGPRVYYAYGTAHGDVFAPAKWADYRSSVAAEASARAKADVAARGLVATVVQDFYVMSAAVRKAASARQGLAEAQRFLTITEQQERGGEVAHADVVKAQIQVSQRQRDAQDADLAALKSRLALSVLIFPDYRENFAITDDLESPASLPSIESVRTAATGNSPDVKAAETALQHEVSSVTAARSGYLPSVSFDYWYGIEANQFATTNPLGQNLLGSSAALTLNIPIWNWGSTQSKLRQAHLRVRQAEADLTLTERTLRSEIASFYAEAQTAQSQVDSLKSSLGLATESLRLTTLRYQSGEATVLEVVDAQTTLIQARNAYDDGLVRYRVALAALQTLTGTL